MARPVIVASNRGPIAFIRDERGEVVATRGGGGLVTALTGVLQGSGGIWIAAAMSEEDRAQAARGLSEVVAEDATYHLRYLSFDTEEYDRYYNGVSNRVLWFLHHCLWDLPRTPVFDGETQRSWESYRQINQRFASALLDEAQPLSPDPAILVQDYHLALVPAMLRARRPDARIAHFSHIPFAGPSYFRILPATIRQELLAGLLGADVVGFHADAWADNFLLCCRHLPGADVDLERRSVRWGGREVKVGIYPISIDADALCGQADSDAVARARELVETSVGDLRLVLRVDRTELSKNILRGFLAYEDLLRRYPRWRGRVRHLALLNPSRRDVPEYRAYTRECLHTADRINDELGEVDWQPVEVVVKDDHPHVVAAYERYDVLLVNPVFDGMNLVAKEGPVLNRRDGVLVLSENAGAYDELGPEALAVNPFDVAATADALARGLEMPEADRARRAARLRDMVRGNRLDEWIGRQLEDLERAQPR